MTWADDQPWQEKGARATIRARHTERFIDEHVQPLLMRRTVASGSAQAFQPIISEKQFWRESDKTLLAAVLLDGFRITDWFPRAPGVYWSSHAQNARENVWAGPSNADAELGRYYSPDSKMNLIEEGGIGTIRLRPRKIDSENCWLATALTGDKCHAGIPLAIPYSLLNQANVRWGDRVLIEGRVRFLQDAGLEETAARVHHARPLIIFVDKLRGLAIERSNKPIVITPVALFETNDQYLHRRERASYTFVHCSADSDAELDSAGEWIDKYVTKYEGHVITNFDEQRPLFAEAPLSYQRLVAKTYDRTVIEQFYGTILVDRIDRVVQETSTQYFGEVHMGHEISVGGSAIINIDSTLSNVTQTITTAPGLDSTQKSELQSLVLSLTRELDRLKASHPDEAQEIAGALDKAVANATKPEKERKSNILQLSAKGLKEAAELVSDVAPKVLATAGLVAKFIIGLS